MTKQLLLARAKVLGVKGRHDMTVAALAVAVATAEQALADAQQSATKRVSPWTRKFYFLDVDRYNECRDLVAKAPLQVRLILKGLLSEGVTTPEDAMTGPQLGELVCPRYLTTKSAPHVLFAYYRAKLEQLGLVFAGNVQPA